MTRTRPEDIDSDMNKYSAQTQTSVTDKIQTRTSVDSVKISNIKNKHSRLNLGKMILNADE